MDKAMSIQARVYIGLIVGGGGWATYHAIAGWHSDDLLRFLCNLVACIVVSGLKVNLPGIKGTMSVNFLFILIGVSQMSLGETLIIGCAGTLVQCIWKAKNPVRPIRLLFSLANMALAVNGCYAFCGLLPLKNTPGGVAGVFLYEHGAGRRSGRADGEAPAGANVARLLFLVFSFLRGRSFHSLAAVPGQPEI